MQFQAVKISVN